MDQRNMVQRNMVQRNMDQRNMVQRNMTIWLICVLYQHHADYGSARLSLRT
jgi:hypothetical protein